MDTKIHVPDHILDAITAMLSASNPGLTKEDVRVRFDGETLGNDQLYRRREVADRLKVSLSTIDRWLAEGTLGKVNIGGSVRITETEIQRLLHQAA